MNDAGTERTVCAACGADMLCSEHGLSLPCDMCEAEGLALSLLCGSCGSCGNTEVREAEFDPLICHACGKVYLHGDADGLCDDPMCGGAHLEPLLGFVSYRRTYTSHRDPAEKNEVAVRIKERVEKVLHAQKVQGGFFIDKSGIEREDFAKKISSTIRACKGRVFLLILTPGALDPRDDDEDWMRNEIHLAIQHGMEIIPVKASNFRKDDDFKFPAKLPEEISPIQKMNVNLSYIGDLEEHSIIDAIHRINNEVKRALDKTPLRQPSASKANRQGVNDSESTPKTSTSSQRKKSTETSSAVDQFNLGFKYANGDGVPKDDREAVKWYRLAADQGLANAQYNLGCGYANGKGVPQDDQEAVKWFRLAANQGLAAAQYALGFMYESGRGVPKGDKEAVKWFRLAAEQGHATAQYNLGLRHREGDGVSKDFNKAAKWLRLAADQGHRNAQYKMGRLEENDVEREKWLRLAANQGHVDAQYELGEWYEKDPLHDEARKFIEQLGYWPSSGEIQSHFGIYILRSIRISHELKVAWNGRTLDNKEAAKWYRLAADQGHRDAQFKLGSMYANGQGVHQDANEATKWYRLAADQGHGEAKCRLEAYR